jgi:hypothetical protein
VRTTLLAGFAALGPHDQARMTSYWPSVRTAWTKSPSVSAVCDAKANSARQVPSGLASRTAPLPRRGWSARRRSRCLWSYERSRIPVLRSLPYLLSQQVTNVAVLPFGPMMPLMTRGLCP